MRLISHPVLCNYYVTYRCNAKCGFCDIWLRPSPYTDVNTVHENLIALRKLGVKVVDFTGGEPLLHVEIDKILKIAKELGFITTLTTNGLLFPKRANQIKGLVDMLHFSLDSAEKNKHDAMRGVACFEFVMQSIKICKDLGERPDILFTVFEGNVDEIERVYYEICIPNNLVLILNPVFDYNQVESGPQLTLGSLEKISKWGKKRMVYLNQAFIQLRKDGGNHVKNPICKAGSSTIVISPDNKLQLPCYHLGIEEIPIDGDLYSLFKSTKVQQIIANEGRYPGCEGCTINCYMQPSFAVELNRYWWKALPSTIKYNRIKGTWKELVKL